MVTLVLLALPGLAILILGIIELSRSAAFERGTSQIEAEAEAWRLYRRRGLTHHELQYRFRLPETDQEYTYTDATGRSNLWAQVEPASWQASRRSKRITVSYVVDDPSVNRPLDATDTGIGDHIAAVAVGSIWSLLALGTMLKIALTPPKRSPEARAPNI